MQLGVYSKQLCAKHEMCGRISSYLTGLSSLFVVVEQAQHVHYKTLSTTVSHNCAATDF